MGFTSASTFVFVIGLISPISLLIRKQQSYYAKVDQLSFSFMAEENSQLNNLQEENGALELQSLVERVGDLPLLSPKEGCDSKGTSPSFGEYEQQQLEKGKRPRQPGATKTPKNIYTEIFWRPLMSQYFIDFT
ncbi:uncharacterized protein LOC108320244 [Vigna angularis]|uniref:uncharacterized protein LOC108320244 n=1 Tax=Phaseolus angularis TaxID=3914 RepID=UPI0022B4DBC6|nr:uncharacterized protein LOC108320244 [Vigna angularis]XP_052724401.1 uncharacterized protein LOC108320244 [Vigna angularis]XP_052724402.1 uncharacterized protein LOC108320244 [Vigna angularis]